MTSQQQPIDKYKEIVAGSTKDMDPGEFPRPETSEMVRPELGSANAHPDFLRPTVSRLPSSAAAKDAFGVPLGVVVQPLAQSEVPLVDFDQVDHIPRCRKCRAYINPWFKWADHGRRFVCNMCGHSQDVDNKYMSSLIDHGSNARPELTYGSVEFEAGDDYMVRAPMPPSYIFVIDVSRAAVHSGTVQDVVENVRNAIEDIHSSPGGERAKVGFMAFDSVLYAFSMRSSLKSPSMMEVPDLERAADMLPPDVLVNLDEQRGQVEAVLDIITDEFSASAEKDSAFGPAVRAALSVLGQAQGGKMMMFQSTRPSIGPGKLNRRVDSKLNGTDREHLLRVPSDPFYKKLASECAKAQVAVDLFTFGVDGEGLDLPSLSALPKFTGGSHYYYQGYPGGTASREKFECDLSHNINRTTGWEAVVRIRVGPGFKIRNFEGNYFMRSTDLIAMPSPHSDHAFGIELMHREQSPASMGVQVTFIQTALLYTTSGGARRIRIHNLRLPLARNVSELYNSVDAEALAVLTARQAAGRCLTQRLSEVRKTVLGRMCEGLRQFRSHVRSAARSPSKLLFPDTMQLVPLYTMCILKTVAMQGTATDVDPDERAVSIFELLQMPVNEALTYLCPKLFPLHLLPEDAGSVLKETGDTVMPPPMPLNGQYISTEGAYLADDARELLLWVGTGLNAGVAEELFGVNEYEGAIAGHEVQLKLRQDTDLGARVCRIVARLQAQQTRHKPLVLMIRSQMANQKLARVLKEDTAGDFSVRIGDYANFLSTVHAHVQVQPKSSSNGSISAAQ
jgi:protein transport protein SEC24